MQGQTLSSRELVEGVVVGDPVFCGKKITLCWLLQRPPQARCLASELSPFCVCGLLLGELVLVDG